MPEEIGHIFTKDELDTFETYSELRDYIASELKKAYDEKMTLVEPEQKSAIEKQVYLQVVDKDWRTSLSNGYLKNRYWFKGI